LAQRRLAARGELWAPTVRRAGYVAQRNRRVGVVAVLWGGSRLEGRACLWL